MGQATKTSFAKGHTPKTGEKGSKGPPVEAFRSYIAGVAASAAYRKKLRERMTAGKLSPGLEGQLLAFALGASGPLPMPPGSSGAPEPAPLAPIDLLAQKLLNLEGPELIAALAAMSHVNVATTTQEEEPA